MEHVKIIRDGAHLKLVSDPVCERHRPVLFDGIASGEHAIPTVVLVTSPQPTIIWSVGAENIFPEPLSKRNPFVETITALAAVVAAAFVNLRSASHEHRATLSAHSLQRQFRHGPDGCLFMLCHLVAHRLSSRRRGVS